MQANAELHLRRAEFRTCLHIRHIYNNYFIYMYIYIILFCFSLSFVDYNKLIKL